MAIPDYQSLMLPLLESIADGKVHNFRDIIENLAKRFKVTDAERWEFLPSGAQPVYENRVAWAKTYLKHAGLLNYPQRGTMQITQRGIDVIKEQPKRIDIKFLEKYPEFIEFRTPKRRKAIMIEEKIADQTPEELLENEYQKLKENTERELLERVKLCSPQFFERFVVDLLVKMGYGGSRKDAGEAIGGSGDEGIDGIIKEDKLGLDVIYIQAKRWDNNVGRPEIQKFVGALSGKRANKGVFITTSDFTDDARKYIPSIQHKVILIDGATLAQLMFDHDVGVSTVSKYDIKEIDTDCFSEE